MIVLADQPLLEPVHIRQVATHWLEHSELDYVAAAGTGRSSSAYYFRNIGLGTFGTAFPVIRGARRPVKGRQSAWSACGIARVLLLGC